MSGPEAVVALVFFGTSAGTVITITKAWMRRLEARDRARLGTPTNIEERLSRIEHAVDSIAIEVERVSEGQRFTTRLLSERQPPTGGPPGGRSS
jgi:hypothetical protein